MTGTNITVLDNFFYNIEKNIFFLQQFYSHKEVCGKGSCLIEFRKKEREKPNTSANQQKRTTLNHVFSLTLLVTHWQPLYHIGRLGTAYLDLSIFCIHDISQNKTHIKRTMANLALPKLTLELGPSYTFFLPPSQTSTSLCCSELVLSFHFPKTAFHHEFKQEFTTCIIYYIYL